MSNVCQTIPPGRAAGGQVPVRSRYPSHAYVPRPHYGLRAGPNSIRVHNISYFFQRIYTVLEWQSRSRWEGGNVECQVVGISRGKQLTIQEITQVRPWLGAPGSGRGILRHFPGERSWGVPGRHPAVGAGDAGGANAAAVAAGAAPRAADRGAEGGGGGGDGGQESARARAGAAGGDAFRGLGGC